jgi:hypothetical protein
VGRAILAVGPCHDDRDPDGSASTSRSVRRTRSGVRSDSHLGLDFAHEASKYFTGSLDEVAIYPFMLSAAEIAAHYQAGITTHTHSTHYLLETDSTRTVRTSYVDGPGGDLVAFGGPSTKAILKLAGGQPTIELAHHHLVAVMQV